jgi:Ser/Thr protein kinase RdoA (MazF antagonist)
MNFHSNNLKAALIQAIEEDYGLEIENMKFLLRGFGGDCYRLETSERGDYFLKIHNPVANQMTAASSRDFYLPLMHQLHAKRILPDIPYPITTLDGHFSMEFGENELVITNFIKADLVGFDRIPNALMIHLAERVGILHNCLEKMVFNHPFEEQFKIVFEKDLRACFDQISRLSIEATPGQTALRDIILPHKDQIFDNLQTLKDLQVYARSIQKPKVICHTDLHGGNLMTDPSGKLYILDWENAMIAPPEHDLFFFAGEDDFWESFWLHYTSQFPAASIDPELLRFYFFRRGLEDVADFIFRILRRENSPERDQQEIKWMLDCLEGMSQIEGTVTKIRERL